jgi:hypothetical protein
VDDETRKRIEALESRVRRLEIASSVLAEIAGREDVEARVRQQVKALERVGLDDDDDNREDARGADAGAVRGSVYRGASVTSATRLACGVCRRPLEPDDPEIVLGDAGRVCLLCSQRARR